MWYKSARHVWTRHVRLQIFIRDHSEDGRHAAYTAGTAGDHARRLSIFLGEAHKVRVGNGLWKEF